jgi:hypothetical protein
MLGAPLERLRPELFHFTRHKAILQGMLELSGSDIEITSSSLAYLFLEHGTLLEAGGPTYLAELEAAGTSPGAMPVELQALEFAYRQRAAVHLGRISSNATAGTDPVETITRMRDAAEAALSNGVGPRRLSDASLPLAQLVAQALAPPEPLLGKGLLVPRGLMLLAGKPGTGKSRLAIELAADLAHGAGAWLGQTVHQACRVGYYAAEIEDHQFAERAKRLIDDIHTSAIEVIAKNLSPDPPSLLDGVGLTDLERWIRDRALQVVVLDALWRFIGMGSEDNETFAILVKSLDRLAQRTGCAFIVIHHERKGTPGQVENDPLDAVRGGSNLTGGFHTVARLERMQGGQLRVVFAKVNYGPEPKPVWLASPEDGGRFVVTEEPGEASKQRGEKTRQRILDALFRITTGSAEQVAAEIGEKAPSVTRIREVLGQLAEEGKVAAGESVREGRKTTKMWAVVYDDADHNDDTDQPTSALSSDWETTEMPI